MPRTTQREVANCLRKAGNRIVRYYELDAIYGNDALRTARRAPPSPTRSTQPDALPPSPTRSAQPDALPPSPTRFGLSVCGLRTHALQGTTRS